jgi:hypothetical protein
MRRFNLVEIRIPKKFSEEQIENFFGILISMRLQKAYSSHKYEQSFPWIYYSCIKSYQVICVNIVNFFKLIPLIHPSFTWWISSMPLWKGAFHKWIWLKLFWGKDWPKGIWKLLMWEYPWISLFCLDISPFIYLFVSSSSTSPKFPLFNYKYIYWKRVNSYWYGVVDLF